MRIFDVIPLLYVVLLFFLYGIGCCSISNFNHDGVSYVIIVVLVEWYFMRLVLVLVIQANESIHPLAGFIKEQESPFFMSHFLT